MEFPTFFGQSLKGPPPHPPTHPKTTKKKQQKP